MDDWRPVVFILGVLILIISLFRMGRRRRRRAKSRPERRDHREDAIERVRAEPPANVGRGEDLSELFVQIQELGRETEARLDNRIRHAKRLLEDADKILYELETKIRDARMVGVVAESPQSESLFATVPATQKPQFVDVTDDGNPEDAAPDPLPRAVTRDPHEAEIARLAAEGEPPDAIAQAVERPLGEVQLILSLIEAKNRNAS